MSRYSSSTSNPQITSPYLKVNNEDASFSSSFQRSFSFFVRLADYSDISQ
uniref:Uncharacterized protein n=1 Tax=Siphoviridae sp. ctgN495 TaxID=2825608 RepID=A0A8S5UCQ8_9CAUD|nr:MAG TPA: hypothetical protein [Siphoviridae sp. ctgN495]DAK99590.1 MAG TPA: hypothetical protein [Caudoviricetes sp.]